MSVLHAVLIWQHKLLLASHVERVVEDLAYSALGPIRPRLAQHVQLPKCLATLSALWVSVPELASAIVGAA